MGISTIQVKSIWCNTGNWLTIKNLLLDCEFERVLSGEDQRVIFQGTRGDPTACIVSFHKAIKMIGHGCRAFVTSLVELEFEDKDLSSIHVVSKFPETFPKELPGLPPTREVEFSIDLISGTTPFLRLHIE